MKYFGSFLVFIFVHIHANHTVSSQMSASVTSLVMLVLLIIAPHLL